MDPMRVILWMVISSCIFAASVLIHRAFVEQSLFQKIYGRYRGNLEKKVKEENWFVSKYGVIENRSFFYKVDRLVTMSGLKNGFSFLSGEVFVGILLASFVAVAVLGSRVSRNVFLSIFLATAVMTAEVLVVVFLSGRTYNRD